MILGGGPKLIPCISLWQPWAQFVAVGWKTIEARTHSRFASLVGRRIAIHATKYWDETWEDIAGRYLTLEQIEKTESLFESGGGFLQCSCKVREHRRLEYEDSARALIECYSMRYGLILDDVKQILPPRAPIKGKQGIFYVPEDLCA